MTNKNTHAWGCNIFLQFNFGIDRPLSLINISQGQSSRTTPFGYAIGDILRTTRTPGSEDASPSGGDQSSLLFCGAQEAVFIGPDT